MLPKNVGGGKLLQKREKLGENSPSPLDASCLPDTELRVIFFTSHVSLFAVFNVRFFKTGNVVIRIYIYNSNNKLKSNCKVINILKM